MKKEVLILLALLFIPYNILGVDLGNGVLGVLFGIILLASGFRKPLVRTPEQRRIFYLLIGITVLSGVSLGFTANFGSSLQGFGLYLGLPIVYFALRMDGGLDEWKIGYGIGIGALISLVGVVFFPEVFSLSGRLQGLLNYSNSYGLLLLLGILFLWKNKNLLGFGFITTMVVALLMTGSRTSLILAILSVGLLIIEDIRKNEGTLATLAVGVGVPIYALFEWNPLTGLMVLLLFIGADYILNLPTFIEKRLRNLGKRKKDLQIATALGVTIITVTLLSTTGMGARMQEIGLNTGVLQERFILFSDGLSAIMKNPLGHGLNSFEYLQYVNQSAFYDVRYLHNGFLQVGFDLGILGMILLVASLIFIGREVKSHTGKIAFSVLLVHSCFDFNMSYMLFYGVLFALGANGDPTKGSVRLSKWVLGFILISTIFMTYLCSVQFLERAVENRIADGKYDEGITLSSFVKFIGGDREGLLLLEAEGYMLKGRYPESISALEKMAAGNPKDLRSYVNLSALYRNQGDYRKSIEGLKYVILRQPFNPSLYDLYNEILTEWEGKDPDSVAVERRWILGYREESLKRLNPNAIFLKNQLFLQK